jgi:hypothetical protein
LAESGLFSRPCPERKSDRFRPKAAVFRATFGLPITSDKVASCCQAMTTIGHLFAGSSTSRDEFDKTQLNQCGRINGRDNLSTKDEYKTYQYENMEKVAEKMIAILDKETRK